MADIMGKVFAPRELTQVDWRSDPVGYCRRVLGVEPWDKQIEIIEAVRDYPRVAVKSGHKIGKSKCAGIIAWWFFASFPGARVILTSASSRQVRSILWREVRSLYRNAKIKPSDTPPLKVPDPGLEVDDGREIKGFTTDDPERMAGISGESVLFIVDEASGVAPEIFEAIEGNRAGGARVLMLSNPTQTTGEFFEAFNTKREFYKTLTVSSEDTPNVREGRNVIPGLATVGWVEEKRREWGVGSPLYSVRVAGQFPAQAKNAVVSLGVIEAARERWEDLQHKCSPKCAEPCDLATALDRGAYDGRLHIGVDVARFGDDDSVIVCRRGLMHVSTEAINGMDVVSIAGSVILAARSARRPGEDRPIIKVDVIGIGGGVADILRQHTDVVVVDVNVSEASQRPNEYANLRAQLHFDLARWLKDGGAIQEDAKLEQELLAPTYSFDMKGRQKIEAKEEIKKRLGRSPDRSDALALAVYDSGETDIIMPAQRVTSRWSAVSGRGFG
jgi:hypothetical protein